MKMGNLQLRWLGVIRLMTLIFVCSFVLQIAQGAAETAISKRADVIQIDSMKHFGSLERPVVGFPHDTHTDFLEKNNKDCTTCHLLENEKLSPKFKRLRDIGKQEVMEIYHDNCIVCHRKNDLKAENPGPLECGECHSKRPRFTSSRQPMGLDKSLHFRHSSALDNKCDLCHHEYDPKAEKLFYAKEKEGTCRYCHKAVTEENTLSMQLASHASCLDCHQERLVKKQSAGPIKCAGCHDLKAQNAIEKISPLPRMKRKQPDVIFVKKGTTDEKIDIRMNPVPFNHAAHETSNETCRTCHHAGLTSCNACHDMDESIKGKGVKLESAMHQTESAQSCVGCHKIRQNDKNCAGCHAFIEKSGQKNTATCGLCHMNRPDEIQNFYQQPDAVKQILLTRTTMTDTFRSEDIPENVVIQSLSKKYGPVKLPHRKIVLTLVKNIQGNKLAGYFHREKGTVCQGCHHNSPAAVKPPKCRSCHGNAFDPNQLFKPSLVAAYHRQCMDCHEEMGITKPISTDCTACHIEKKDWLTTSG